MRGKLLVLAISTVGLIGCKGAIETPVVAGVPSTPASTPVATPSVDLTKSVVGNWKADPGSLKVDFGTFAQDPDFQKQIPEKEKAMRKEVAGGTIDLKADGTYTSSNPEGKPETGAYRLDGRNVIFTPGSAAPDPNMSVVVSDDGKKLTLKIAQAGISATVDLTKS